MGTTFFIILLFLKKKKKIFNYPNFFKPLNGYFHKEAIQGLTGDQVFQTLRNISKQCFGQFPLKETFNRGNLNEATSMAELNLFMQSDSYEVNRLESLHSGKFTEAATGDVL